MSEYLKEDYTVISLDFQDIDSDVYVNSGTFTQGFARLLMDAHEFAGADIPENILMAFDEINQKPADIIRMDELFRIFRRWCKDSKRKIVLIIDEVDTASNNQVFLDFLAQLRSGYLKRRTIPTFQSVILAGVTDVKHLRAKIRPEDAHKENSPWNIAVDFIIDMSLSEDGIRGMLDDYENDHHTGMDTEEIARLIREYTDGYPFLVSRICQLIDEYVLKNKSGHDAWTKQGFEEAVKLILAEDNTLFQSLTKNLNTFPKMKEAIRSILMEGTKLAWNPDQNDIVQMQMYGLIRNDNNAVRISNRIFEMRLYNLFLSDEELRNNVFSRAGDLAGNQFVDNGEAPDITKTVRNRSWSIWIISG